VGLDRRQPFLVAQEEEELGFGARGHAVKAQLLQPLDLALEHPAGVTFERGTVGVGNVADQAGYAPPAGVLDLVGEDDESVVVGLEQHVGLFDAGEPLDRRAVEHHLAVQGLLELRDGHLDVLVLAQNVGELEPQEPDVVFGHRLEDFFLRESHTATLYG
jgi:hypothetical protein